MIFPLPKRALPVMLSPMIAEAREAFQFDAIDDVVSDIAQGAYGHRDR